MDFPCSLPTLAGAFLLCLGTVPASAQTYRPDAEGYPCAHHGEFAIVQDGLGYSIREKPALPVAPVPFTAIKVGNSLTLDSRLFARTSLVRPESTHVTQR
ncbi:MULTISPECIES: hypothetical protein [unclassified Novosphingobium]|uniref:hypothetical protein n=1 Tax=unclassified Novosphingobium TaxID=2644732 RepID=UPI001493F9AA|nr:MULTISPECIES: hypothetical protein [unclassified Novosphingobium]MBB3357019.1 hypothetical protein [Novosphingobium sp. BK256]MBB3373420.1 hypothetical protein [Novosphingobium sp. BK280]MBB3377789.1 hypothetical protein [Novosphingobium sp. BK258]MBB3418800.1 hypothetical protein [Novosphingobium sp. BK267]MBB3450365.1 hypothetical protein [Novosphingobium sp. BK352]